MTWPGGDSRLGPGQGEGWVFLGAGGGWSAGSGVRGCVQGAARGGHAGKPLPFFACAGPLCVAVPRGLPEEDQGVASRGKSQDVAFPWAPGTRDPLVRPASPISYPHGGPSPAAAPRMLTAMARPHSQQPVARVTRVAVARGWGHVRGSSPAGTLP